MNKNDKTLILNAIKEHYKFRFDKDFADFLGIGPTLLSSWYSRNTINWDLIFTKCVDIDFNKLIKEGNVVELKSEHVNLINDPKIKYKSTKKIINGIPLVEPYAVAGFGSSDFSIGERDVKDYYVVPKFKDRKIDFMIEVHGSSMYPKYNSGDIVACTIIRNSKFIQWNKVHIIATKEQGILIKRLDVSDKPNCLKAISDNKDYRAFDIPEDEITGIAIVVGVIRLE